MTDFDESAWWADCGNTYHEEQTAALHAIYDLWREGDYETVDFLLKILQGAWV